MNIAASRALPAVGERDHVTGSSSPKLTLVEYGDFGCPYCFQASRPVKALLDRLDGLRLVWRHFPVPELHPRAELAAELSELAGLHGKFWDAHSLLLTPRGRFSRDDLLSVAGRLELDPAETHAALRGHTVSRARARRHRGRQASWGPRDADLLRRWRAPGPALARTPADRAGTPSSSLTARPDQCETTVGEASAGPQAYRKRRTRVSTSARSAPIPSRANAFDVQITAGSASERERGRDRSRSRRRCRRP